MSKEEILDRYLNTSTSATAPTANQAAAEPYFGVGVQQLDVGQAAMLAGIIRNPITYNPVRFPERAAQRRLRRPRPHGRRPLSSPGTRGTFLKEAAPTDARSSTEVLPAPNDYFPTEVAQQILNDPAFAMLGETVRTSATRRCIPGGPAGLHHASTRRRSSRRWRPATPGRASARERRRAASREPSRGASWPASPTAAHHHGRVGRARHRRGAHDGRRTRVRQLQVQPRHPEPSGVGSSMKTFVLATIMEQGYSPDDIINGIAPCNFADEKSAPSRRTGVRRCRRPAAVRLLVDLAAVRVDDRHERAAAARARRQPGGRPHGARGADDQRHVARTARRAPRLRSLRVGSISPNHTTPGRTRLPQRAQRRRPARARRRAVVAGGRARAAIEPAVALDVAVQADRVGVAGALVQVVDVLAHQREHAGAAPRERAQRQMPGVGLRGAHAVAALGVPVPHALRDRRESPPRWPAAPGRSATTGPSSRRETSRCRSRRSCRRR